MASAGSIYVDLLLNDGKYVQGINKSRRLTNQAAQSWQRDAYKTRDAFQSVINPVDNISQSVMRLGGALAGALSIQRIVAYSDTWRGLEGRLSIIADSMGEITAAQDALFEVAQRTRQPLEGITSFYTRLNQFIPEAERAQYDLLGVTESVASALAITGETGASATAAMIQFTQAIGTNFEAAGQELRSLQEQAPRLNQALVNALGDGTKSLKQLKDEGKLTRESVLNALSGMGEEGQRLRYELAKLDLTVGQSFQRLDNAFLQFIGRSDAVNSGTSSIALAVSGLAENLDTVAKVAVVLSSVMVTRVVSSFAAAQIQAVSYQIALARMAGISATAATSLLGLSAAARVAGASLALVGGPVGLAVIAAIAAFTFQTTEAEKAQERYNLILDKTREGYGLYARASEETRKQIEQDANARIKAMQRELDQLGKLVASYASLDSGSVIDSLAVVLDDFAKRFLFIPGQSPTEVLEQFEAAQAAYDEMIRQRDNAREAGVGGSSSSGGGVAETEKELAAIYKRNREAILGLDSATIKYKDTLAELETLKQAGLITNEQYIEAQQRVIKEFEESSEKAGVWSFDIEEAGKRASQNIQDSFADFLFDPFAEGLDGMLLGFINVIQKMIAEAAAAQILGSLFGEGGIDLSGDSKLGGIVGSAATGIGDFFGGFFADGGYLEPGKFGVAGEKEAELIYGGRAGVTVVPQSKMGSGGNTYNIDARGADQGAVRRLEQALLSMAGPGVIEQRVSNAQSRGRL